MLFRVSVPSMINNIIYYLIDCLSVFAYLFQPTIPIHLEEMHHSGPV